jgi:hypothetical protein
MSKSDDARIAALLRERDGLVQHGKDDRVVQVDAELSRLGYEAPEPASVPEPVVPDPGTQEPKGRTTKGRPPRTAG